MMMTGELLKMGLMLVVMVMIVLGYWGQPKFAPQR